MQLKGEEKKKREIWKDLQHVNRRTFRKLENIPSAHTCAGACVCVHVYSLTQHKQQQKEGNRISQNERNLYYREIIELSEKQDSLLVP